MVRVAVIGAGANGLPAIKCCIDEGIDVTCFEASDRVGGLWNFSEGEDKSSMTRSTIANISKEMMSYSTFPVPDNFPVYMHNTKVLEYLNLYANHFNARKYIKFNTKVINVSRISQERDSKYRVTYVKFGKEITGQVTEIFDAVMVCTGHHWKYTLPKFDGMDRFKGVQIHSKAYKDFRSFKDKVVVVVGSGNFGCDIAAELSSHCKQVYLSTRRGVWIFSRLFRGEPSDQLANRRVIKLIPKAWLIKLATKMLSLNYNHDLLGVKPKTPLLSQHPTANDLLPWKIMNSSIIIKPNIKCLSDSSVTFVDDSVIDGVDAVIYCTGYDIEFPCLNEDLVKCKNNRVELYKYVFPPDQKYLAVIGCLQPIGGVMTMAELQARWATRVFKGLVELPTEDKMMEDITLKRTEMQKQFYASKRHTIEVDYIEYSDEIAELIGCRPNLWKIFLQDPRLGIYCMFGPLFPYQYRLQGPGKWSGAREALMSAEDRVRHSSMTRIVQDVKEPESMSRKAFLISILIILLFILFYSFVKM